MPRRTTLSLLALAVTCTTTAATSIDDFLSAMSGTQPQVQWDVATAVTGDFNGDGASDFAVVGYKNDGIVLAVDVENGSQQADVQFMSFGVDRGVQAAVCVTPVHLALVALSCDVEGVSLPGCAEVPGASGLSVSDDECDPINLYWNKTEKRMSWWRN